MQKRILSITILVLVCSVILIPTAISEEVLLSIKDGVLHFQSHAVQLANVEKPVLVKKSANNIELHVQTPDGVQKFDLGDITLSVVQSAVNYVRLETVGSGGNTARPKSTAKPEPDIRQQNPCPYCGKPNIHGGHVCPLCDKPFCQHDENACLRIANPAQTPVPTKNAEGKTTSHYVASDGSYVMGGPGNNTIWRPDAFITPSPSPSTSPDILAPPSGYDE